MFICVILRNEGSAFLFGKSRSFVPPRKPGGQQARSPHHNYASKYDKIKRCGQNGVFWGRIYIETHADIMRALMPHTTGFGHHPSPDSGTQSIEQI
jgi:hypothetical protein